MLSSIDVAPVTEAIMPEFSENAVVALRARYLIKEGGKVVETPDELMRRVARCLARPERDTYGHSDAQVSFWESRFYELLRSFKFMVNSPTLMNADRPLSMLSACFVIPLEDSIESIMECARLTALVQRAGGGCGYSLDALRPCGNYIKSSGGTTSGPISFWRMLSEVTQAIQQGAYRRGANMAMMSVNSPDILKFLYAKQNLSQITNYNISVKVDDVFMENVSAAPSKVHKVHNFLTGTDYALPRSILDTVVSAAAVGVADQMQIRKLDNCYGIADLVPYNEATAETCLTVGDIWTILTTNGHATGEPGIAFMDRVRETEPTPHVGLIHASNPCAEAMLLPAEACNLGSINLAAFINLTTADTATLDEKIDIDGLRNAVRVAVRMLDNVIDANVYPDPVIDRVVKGNRKIGLGIMGMADALFMLGVRYDSVDGIATAGRLMEIVSTAAMEADQDLAAERGTFPNWVGSRWDQRGVRLRNADVTSIAPTGTISIITDCSCGIEPVFSLAFKRNVLDGKTLYQGHAYFERVAKENGFWREDLLEEAMQHGSIQHLDYVPPRFKEIFRCAHDVEPYWHVRMQAEIQKHVTNAVSKTINLPANATVQDVSDAMKLAWSTKCKAISVYRDGCRASQPMQLGKVTSASISPPITPVIECTAMVPPRGHLEPTAQICGAVRIRVQTVFGSLHLHVVEDDTGRPVEVFAHCGSNGGVEQADLEAICRLGSLLLRSGHDLSLLISQLSHPGTNVSSVGGINSLPQAIAMGLVQYLERGRGIAPHAAQGGANGQCNGHAMALSSDIVQRRMQRDAGYRITCRSDDANCPGIVTRNGNCATCPKCGVSTCM